MNAYRVVSTVHREFNTLNIKLSSYTMNFIDFITACTVDGHLVPITCFSATLYFRETETENFMKNLKLGF